LSQFYQIHPDNPQAQALIDAAGSLRSRPPANRSSQTKSPPPPRATEPQPAVVQPETRPAAPLRSSPARSVPAPEPKPRATSNPGPVSTTAALRVDVFSYLSKGVLTVYADQDQVLLQPFRFVQKSGFMRKKKSAGRLETSVELPSGPTEFRIYVSADGQETQTVSLQGELSGGRTHVLRLIIAENGSASAQLN